MLSFGNKLEKLLDDLFGDDGDFAMEDIEILNVGFRPLQTLGCCCTYNYAGYGAAEE